MSSVESKSKIKFKNELIKNLPFFPDDKNTLTELKSYNLDKVLFYFLHWATRQIPRRERRVHRYTELTSDKRYKSYKEQINLLLNKVRNGEDLTPYLSLRAHKKGYTPRYRILNGDAKSWEDKDQILNTKGFHHFHLNMTVQNTGLSLRTNEVLFAKVTRDSFHAVALFDHSVFDQLSDSELTDERSRMWDIYDKYITFGMAPDTGYMSNPITTSGHPLAIKLMARDYAHIINEHDGKLTDRQFINDLYGQSEKPSPSRFKLEWYIHGLDLCILDKKNNVNFVVKKGYL